MESTERVLEAPESTPICSQELGEEQSSSGEATRCKKPKLVIQMISTPGC